jgi:hypothetical protein
MIDKKSMVKTLDKIITKASMTPDLKKAVGEIKTALNRNQIRKASELSTVKSFIMGTLDTGKSHFGEDRKYNIKILGGRDVYGLLDSINFDLSMESGAMPAGMMVITSQGVKSREPWYFKSPTMMKIKKEREEIEREVGKLRKIV